MRKVKRNVFFPLSLSRTVLAFRGNEMISLLARSRSQVVRQMTYPREVIILTKHGGSRCTQSRGVLWFWTNSFERGAWYLNLEDPLLLMFYCNFIIKFLKKFKINPFPYGHGPLCASLRGSRQSKT